MKLKTTITQDHDLIRSNLQQLIDLQNIDVSSKQHLLQQLLMLLAAHETAEESVVSIISVTTPKLRSEAAENREAHRLVNFLMQKLSVTSDPLLWNARLEILSELLTHHFESEEKCLFPHIEHELDRLESASMGEHYLQVRERNTSFSYLEMERQCG